MPKLNENYWDCGCESRYIQPKDKRVCPICLAIQEDSPDAHEVEIKPENMADRTNIWNHETALMGSIISGLFAFMGEPIRFESTESYGRIINCINSYMNAEKLHDYEKDFLESAIIYLMCDLSKHIQLFKGIEKS